MNNLTKILSKLAHKKVLITGADGMLGKAFRETLATYVSNCDIIAPSKSELDVTSNDKVFSFITHYIDYILHCAAESCVDCCEEDPQKSYEIIVKGTSNVIQLAKIKKSKLFFPQSFLIYDGESIPINEDTIPHPLCIYGKQKLEAERLVLKELPDALVVRMGGFFGGREIDKRFVGQIIKQVSILIGQGKKSLEVGDRIWQPTFTNDLALNILILLSEGKNGTYNMACHGQASFYELTKEIMSILDLEKKINIIPVTSSQFNQKEKAKRPLLALLDNERLRKEHLDYQRDWKESLKEYLSHTYFKKMF
jgi:dTDP-4-dehydrorhamnose reductase